MIDSAILIVPYQVSSSCFDPTFTLMNRSNTWITVHVFGAAEAEGNACFSTITPSFPLSIAPSRCQATLRACAPFDPSSCLVLILLYMYSMYIRSLVHPYVESLLSCPILHVRSVRIVPVTVLLLLGGKSVIQRRVMKGKSPECGRHTPSPPIRRNGLLEPGAYKCNLLQLI